MNHGAQQIDPLVTQVADFMDRRSLLSPGGSVVVGVSGGADSLALLGVLRDLSALNGRGYKLTVAHLNHMIRADATDDATFVQQLAKRLDLPCVVENRDVPAESRQRRQGLEETARTVRYEFMLEVARRVGARHVAVGHHADDNVETILHRMIRGTALRGLSGMPAARPMNGTDVTLLRPLLTCRRTEIEAFCHRRGLEWRSDWTNVDTAYSRNFIRGELLPLIRGRLNPRVDEALLRLAQLSAEADTLLAAMAQDVLRAAVVERSEKACVLDTLTLAGQPSAVRTYALRLALEQLGAPQRDLSAEHWLALRELIVAPPPAAIDLPGGFSARRDGNDVILQRLGPRRMVVQEEPEEQAVVALECPGRTRLGDGRTIDCNVGPRDAKTLQEHLDSPRRGVEMLDADAVAGALYCRPRLEGDVFEPLGAPGRQRVGDFLTNIKLPRSRRDQALCICDAKGIAYLAPLRLADRVKVTADTRRVLTLAISPDWPADEA